MGILSGYIIVINPGHGGYDSGAVGKVYEKDINLTEARRMRDKFAALGATVILTRDSDVHMYLTERADIANAAGADLYLSNHHNGGYSTKNYATAVVYPGSSGGIKLANLFLDYWCPASGLERAAVIQRDDTDVTASNMTAVIGEAWFVDNPANADKYLNGNWVELEATCWVNAVLSYFGLAADQKPTVSTPATSAPADQTNKYGFTSVFDSSNYLAIGSEGSDVMQLQRDMNFCGYRAADGSKFAEDGDFGPATKYGVECVQRFHGRTVDGEYGCDSDISLMCEVADIQTALNAHGYHLTVDGASGPASDAALNDFQSKNGLRVDTSCGDETRGKLGI